MVQITLRGFDSNQFATYHHNNTDDDHIHIVASRIRFDSGLVVHDGWDYVRSEKVLRGLEKEYGLTPVIGSREKLARRVSTGQTRRMMREQSEYESGYSSDPPELPIKVKLQQAIDSAVQDHPPMSLMVARLLLLRIEVRAGFTRTGKSKGISYRMQDQAFSGTHLGPGYTFNGITQRTEYEPQRGAIRCE